MADSQQQEIEYLLALLELDGMGPIRLRAVLSNRTPGQAWDAIRRGILPPCDGVGPRLRASWQRKVRTELVGLAEHYRTRGISVIGPQDPRFPEALRVDPDPPALLFADGDLSALRQATVAIVGTRRATPYGIGVARRFGAELAQCGVCVLSGLALGIDAAAHQGALAAGAGGAAPVAVVGCGLDWPYPASNRALWRQVANVGVVLSEWPLGTRPEPWRFPARNRIVAALADVVVIVESHEEGGALITAELAEDRNRPILAVPGSIRSPASIGPHALLRSGSATLATATDDILAALPLRDEPNRPQPTSCFDAAMPNPNAVRTEHALVLNAVGWEPTTFESVAGRVHLSLGDIAHAIEDLLRAGTLSDEGGMFVRRAGPLSPPS